MLFLLLFVYFSLDIDGSTNALSPRSHLLLCILLVFQISLPLQKDSFLYSVAIFIVNKIAIITISVIKIILIVLGRNIFL